MPATVIDTVRGIVAKAPVPYVGRRTPHTMLNPGTRGDMAAQLEAMGGNGTLFAIVNKLSTATSAVDWHMHIRAAGQTCDECEQINVRHVEEHPALVVWNKPNEFFTRQEFVETFQQHVDLTGEGWWVVNRLAGRPIELWPVRPDRMAPVRHPTKFLDGYMYRAPDGEMVPLKLDEVVQLRMPNPSDPWRGMGPVQALLHDLDAARYSAEWNKNFFVNSAEPGGIIEFENSLDDREFDEIAGRWNEQHQGVANAHRVALIERGGKWVSRAFSQRDMQFVELREVSTKVIREAFGMPKFAVGDVDDVNRATADASKAWFAEALTVPRLERIKQALNNDFLPMFGVARRTYEFAYTSPVPEDRGTGNAERNSKATAARELIQAGFDPADVLLTVGLPPMKHTPPPAPQPVEAAA